MRTVRDYEYPKIDTIGFVGFFAHKRHPVPGPKDFKMKVMTKITFL